MQEVTLTCGFKLRSPNRLKGEIIEHAFAEYTRGAEDLLSWFKDNQEDLLANGQALRRDKQTGDLAPTGKYTGDSVYSFLSNRRPGSTWQLGISSNLKKGLFVDICSQMAGHVELAKSQANAGYPSAVIRAEDTEADALAAYEALRINYLDHLTTEDPALWEDQAIALENTLRDATARRNRSKQYRTITTCSKGTSEDAFYLLADPNLHGFYVWLPLLPQDNQFIPAPIRYEGLIDLATGAPFSKRSRLAILLPLEIGKQHGALGWQFENFLKPCLAGSCEYKSAKLSYRCDGIYLFVSFVFSVPDPYPCQRWIGVTSGILYGIDYAVIDGEGRVVDQGRESEGIMADLNLMINQTVAAKQRSGKPVGVRDYYRKQKEAVLHKIANRLIQDAKDFGAGIALEDPGDRGPGGWGRVAHQKLVFIFSYKCKLNSVPFRTVFGAQAARICPRCGGQLDRLDCNRRQINPKSRNKPKGPFYGACQSCGLVARSQAITSVNIARRANYRRADWVNRGSYIGFHQSYDRLYKRSRKGDGQTVSLME